MNPAKIYTTTPVLNLIYRPPYIHCRDGRRPRDYVWRFRIAIGVKAKVRYSKMKHLMQLGQMPPDDPQPTMIHLRKEYLVPEEDFDDYSY